MSVIDIPDIIEPRSYREFSNSKRFISFRVQIETTDLYIKASRDLSQQTKKLVTLARDQVTASIQRRPEFLTSLVPLSEIEGDSALPLKMIRAAMSAGTGPMAAVAGAIAEFVGRELLEFTREIIVENGGDIFLKIDAPIIIGVYAGRSPFSGKIGLVIDPTPVGMGICTSSATVGPSLSLGKTDCATIVSKNTALADAVATTLGNMIKNENDLAPAVDFVSTIPGVEGALAIIGDKLAAKGEIHLAPISAQ